MQSLSVLLGERIKEIRKSKNIKQVELATLVDIEPTNLSKIEKGVHMPKDETLAKISKALDVAFEELFVFSHIQERGELLKRINEIINEAQTDELQFFYKVLLAHCESK